MKIKTKLISMLVIILFIGGCKKDEPASAQASVPSITVSTLSGSGVAGYAEGTASLAKFNGPEGLAVASSGEVYVADTKNNVIRRISPDGTTGLLAGTPDFANGSSATAKFSSPSAVAVDATGNVYVADTEHHSIRKIDVNGSVTTVAGTGTSGLYRWLIFSSSIQLSVCCSGGC